MLNVVGLVLCALGTMMALLQTYAQKAILKHFYRIGPDGELTLVVGGERETSAIRRALSRDAWIQRLGIGLICAGTLCQILAFVDAKP